MKKYFYVTIIALIVASGLINVRPNYDRYKHLPWEKMEEKLIKKNLPYEIKYSENEYFKKGEIIEARVINGMWKVTVCNGVEAPKNTIWGT